MFRWRGAGQTWAQGQLANACSSHTVMATPERSSFGQGLMKVLVEGDADPVVSRSPCQDFPIGGIAHGDFADMDSVATPVPKQLGGDGGEPLIEENGFHAA